MSIVRAEVIAKMRGAFREGLSASRFIRTMKEAGLTYRRTDMLKDWRSVNELERKAGAVRYIRKGYYPTVKSMAAVTWATSKEYMYKVKSQQRLYAGAPLEERFVNIMSDVPMTPEMVQEEARVRSFAQSPPEIGEERIFTTWTAIHRIE